MTTKKSEKKLSEEKAENPDTTSEESELTTDSKEDSPETDANHKTKEPPETELEVAQREAKESYDRFLRVSAEFENYKKRSAREMNEFRKYANESLLRELLPIIDNLERAIDSSINDTEANDCVVEGVDMTLKELLKVLEKFVVTPIDAMGKPFDPTFHEAVMQEETDDHPDNVVLNELQKGYMIHDRLLRPSMVVVSKATEKQSKEKDENQNELDRT